MRLLVCGVSKGEKTELVNLKNQSLSLLFLIILLLPAASQRAASPPGFSLLLPPCSDASIAQSRASGSVLLTGGLKNTARETQPFLSCVTRSRNSNVIGTREVIATSSMTAQQCQAGAPCCPKKPSEGPRSWEGEDTFRLSSLFLSNCFEPSHRRGEESGCLRPAPAARSMGGSSFICPWCLRLGACLPWSPSGPGRRARSEDLSCAGIHRPADPRSPLLSGLFSSLLRAGVEGTQGSLKPV